MKRLCRSDSQKMVCGVCGGIAEYYDCDPTIVRFLFILISLFAGCGVLLYIAAAILMPRPEEI